MRCVAFCTAEKYFLNKIAGFYRKSSYSIDLDRSVLHVYNEPLNQHMFFFSMGCCVFWNLSSRREQELIQTLANFSAQPLENVESAHFIFRIDQETRLKTHDRFNIDVISIEENDSEIKLAVSYGLAQSVKLEAFEEIVQKTIKKNHSLILQLAKDGKISLSGNAISKRMGEIFLERSSVNLSSEYLDMPEYFWQYPLLEDYYIMTEKFLDIKQRVESLNKRLDVLHELFNILTSQLQHRHSTLLELIIIVLIFIEIILSIFSIWLIH